MEYVKRKSYRISVGEVQCKNEFLYNICKYILHNCTVGNEGKKVCHDLILQRYSKVFLSRKYARTIPFSYKRHIHLKTILEYSGYASFISSHSMASDAMHLKDIRNV